MCSFSVFESRSFLFSFVSFITLTLIHTHKCYYSIYCLQLHCLLSCLWYQCWICSMHMWDHHIMLFCSALWMAIGPAKCYSVNFSTFCTCNEQWCRRNGKNTFQNVGTVAVDNVVILANVNNLVTNNVNSNSTTTISFITLSGIITLLAKDQPWLNV